MAANIVMLGSLLATPVVSGNPFAAHFERRVIKDVNGQSLEHSERGVILVDRSGRTRAGFGLGDDDPPAAPPPFASIWDPVQRKAWIVDNGSNRTLMEVPWGAPLIEADANASPAPRRSAAEVGIVEHLVSLGRREIEGLACDGLRRETRAPEGTVVTETWRSPELGHVILETQHTASEQVTYRMYGIRLGDPDPTSFSPNPAAVGAGRLDRWFANVRRLVTR